MPQISLNSFYVVPILEGEDGKGMPEIVYPAIWSPDLRGQLLVMVIDRLGTEIAPRRCGEY